MTFETYLRTKHAEENPQVLDDDLADDFERWLADLEVEEVIDYAEEALKENSIKEEAESIKSTLRRINLNEANDYPLVDISESLADVKEALMNRLKQINELKGK